MHIEGGHLHGIIPLLDITIVVKPVGVFRHELGLVADMIQHHV